MGLLPLLLPLGLLTVLTQGSPDWGAQPRPLPYQEDSQSLRNPHTRPWGSRTPPILRSMVPNIGGSLGDNLGSGNSVEVLPHNSGVQTPPVIQSAVPSYLGWAPNNYQKPTMGDVWSSHQPHIPDMSNPIQPHIPDMWNPTQPHIPDMWNPTQPHIPNMWNPQQTNIPDIQHSRWETKPWDTKPWSRSYTPMGMGGSCYNRCSNRCPSPSPYPCNRPPVCTSRCNIQPRCSSRQPSWTQGETTMCGVSGSGWQQSRPQWGLGQETSGLAIMGQGHITYGQGQTVQYGNTQGTHGQGRWIGTVGEAQRNVGEVNTANMETEEEGSGWPEPYDPAAQGF